MSARKELSIRLHVPRLVYLPLSSMHVYSSRRRVNNHKHAASSSLKNFRDGAREDKNPDPIIVYHHSLSWLQCVPVCVFSTLPKYLSLFPFLENYFFLNLWHYNTSVSNFGEFQVFRMWLVHHTVVIEYWYNDRRAARPSARPSLRLVT